MNIKGNFFNPKQPIVAGIINITPDSFYASSRAALTKEVLHITEKHLSEGASWLDVGAFSSRPGAEAVNEEEELNRLLPALNVIMNAFPEIVISVDTSRSSVARAAIAEGAAIINDITGGDGDPLMYRTIAELKVPYICMHSRGTPLTMQAEANYTDVTAEVIHELSEKIVQIKHSGVTDLIIDPGFGFAKTMEQNYELLANLNRFERFNTPIMVGLSRKSMIYKLLNTTPENALNGTTCLHAIALLKGASILRTHDVKEAVECIRLVSQIQC